MKTQLSTLSPAYRGYDHQDAVVAYALASLLIPRPPYELVRAERKIVQGDVFDDLELIGQRHIRVQIKSHVAAERQLRLADFTTKTIAFRINDVVRSLETQTHLADEYRLLATFEGVEASLLPYLVASDAGAVLLGLHTQRFTLDVGRLWPAGASVIPAWGVLAGVERERFVTLAERFVVEIACPSSSGDLRTPGALEDALLLLLREGVGIGSWPNHSRNPTDVAARLLRNASSLRSSGGEQEQHDVIAALSLRVDYGRVEERLPVEPRRVVERDDDVDVVVALLEKAPRLTITGTPGIGKSRFLFQVAKRLRAAGWLVATHYCFIDLLDTDRVARASVETTFGSIMYELLVEEPSLIASASSRFAAGRRELEAMLTEASSLGYRRRVAIIVDGLDHADRVAGQPQMRAALELASELAELRLPPGVCVIAGSQPGKHLTPLEQSAIEHRLAPWPDQAIRAIVERSELEKTLAECGLAADADRVLARVIERAQGNPLYATYLVRTARSAALDEPGTEHVADIADYLATTPRFDSGLNDYYDWLLSGLAADTGVVWIAELLSLVDFSLSERDIGDIRPQFRHHLKVVLSRLMPVLTEDTGRGGLRVYHESFQRFVRAALDVPTIAAALAQVIDWLEARGLFSDLRAFRSLLRLLQMAGREGDVLVHVGNDFVARACAEGQPGDAVLANLVVAGASAARGRRWPELVRLVELTRAAQHLYHERLLDHELAEEYGRAYASMFGAQALAQRLVHDGRCTFVPRVGLLLCRMCEEADIVPPWQEYLDAHDRDARETRTHYGDGSDAAVAVARLTARCRLEGRDRAIQFCIQALSETTLSLHPADYGYVLGRMFDCDAVRSVVDALAPGSRRAWLRLTVARMANDSKRARHEAETAFHEGLPLKGWGECLSLGIEPSILPRTDLSDLTNRILLPSVQFEPDVVTEWLTQVSIAAALDDELVLLAVEARIPPDSWFRRWLRWAVTLVHPKSTDDDLVASLQHLAKDVEVFVGDPRVCDLHKLHDEIRHSFRRVLVRIGDSRWPEVARALAHISGKTSTWLMGARTGPLPLDAFFELCFATADTAEKRTFAAELGLELLSPQTRTGEFYDTHAHEQLLLCRMLAAADHAQAPLLWKGAAQFLAAYGFHKDITVYELLDPLEVLAKADERRTRRCFQDVLPAVERALVHTDGRETHHGIHQWLDTVARVHPAGAFKYLADDAIADMSISDALGHAWPKALAAAVGSVPAPLIAAGWLAIGWRARADIEGALQAGERLADADPRVGLRLWEAVVGAIEGDTQAAPQELAGLLTVSAARITGGAPPVLSESAAADESRDSPASVEQPTDRMWLKGGLRIANGATPLQLASAVRLWRRQTESKRTSEALVNAVGWRLLEWAENGDSLAAEAALRRIAQDTRSWDGGDLLAGLGEGLARHGARPLAAMALTYAYTRARDGVRRFGGRERDSWFAQAITNASEVAWKTLTEEIEDSIGGGGEYGVTAHTIELLAASDLVDEAFAAWAAAHEAVMFRLPATGRADELSTPYDPDCDSLSTMLAAALIGRMNCFEVHEKRLAAAAFHLIASREPGVITDGVALALKRAPLSTTTVVLQLLCESQVPIATIGMLFDELSTAAATEFVATRFLARELLRRHGSSTPVPPTTVISNPLPSPEQIQELLEVVGEERVRRIVKIWPEFDTDVAALLDSALASERLGRKMQDALRELHPDRKGRKWSVWLPLYEEIEVALQTAGAAIRTALAKRGRLNPQIDDRIGALLLNDVKPLIRMVMSRQVRPHYLPFPRARVGENSIAEPFRVPDGPYRDWVLLAHREEEVIVGDGYDKPILGRVQLDSGLMFGSWDGAGLPYGYPDPTVWDLSASRYPPIPSDYSFSGPTVGLDIRRDPFGQIGLLVPHPFLPALAQLKAVESSQGLTLVDAVGQEGLLCRTWQQRYISEEYISDREPTLHGMQVLMRSDLFETLSASTEEPAVCVSVTSRRGAEQAD